MNSIIQLSTERHPNVKKRINTHLFWPNKMKLIIQNQILELLKEIYYLNLVCLRYVLLSVLFLLFLLFLLFPLFPLNPFLLLKYSVIMDRRFENINLKKWNFVKHRYHFLYYPSIFINTLPKTNKDSL